MQPVSWRTPGGQPAVQPSQAQTPQTPHADPDTSPPATPAPPGTERAASQPHPPEPHPPGHSQRLRGLPIAAGIASQLHSQAQPGQAKQGQSSASEEAPAPDACACEICRAAGLWTQDSGNSEGESTVYDFDPDGSWHPDMPQPEPGQTDEAYAFALIPPPPVLVPPAPAMPPGGFNGTTGHDPDTGEQFPLPGFPVPDLPPVNITDHPISSLPQLIIHGFPIIVDRYLEPIFRSPSEILAGNLQDSDVPRPADTAAHHIVAHGDHRMEDIRELLESLGIDIHDAANGVFLPSKPGSEAPGAYHPALHSDEYYDAVRNEFNGVNSRDDAIEALDRIRDRLLDGTYPGSKPVPPKP